GNTPPNRLLAGRDVDHPLPAAPPPGLPPAVRGDRPLPAPVGKAPHIDLPPPRLVRAIGDPFPVRRELTMQLHETRPKNGIGFCSPESGKTHESKLVFGSCSA